MTVEDTELDVLSSAAHWAFVQDILTVDKTAHTIKLRLTITAECFVQVYVNVQKSIVSYTLVFNRSRIYGRDCDGGTGIAILQKHRNSTISPPKGDVLYRWTSSSEKPSRCCRLAVCYSDLVKPAYPAPTLQLRPRRRQLLL